MHRTRRDATIDGVPTAPSAPSVGPTAAPASNTEMLEQMRAGGAPPALGNSDRLAQLRDHRVGQMPVVSPDDVRAGRPGPGPQAFTRVGARPTDVHEMPVVRWEDAGGPPPPGWAERAGPVNRMARARAAAAASPQPPPVQASPTAPRVDPTAPTVRAARPVAPTVELVTPPRPVVPPTRESPSAPVSSPTRASPASSPLPPTRESPAVLAATEEVPRSPAGHPAALRPTSSGPRPPVPEPVAPLAPTEPTTVRPGARPSPAARALERTGAVVSVVQGAAELRSGVEELRRGDTVRGTRDTGSGVANVMTGALTTAGSRAALPLGVATTAVQLDQVANERVRRTGELGQRRGVTSTRSPRDPQRGVNRDYDDVAEVFGRRVQRWIGSPVAGATAAAVRRVTMLPRTAAHGARIAAADAASSVANSGRSDLTDLEARDQEERGVPLASSTPEVRAERLRQRANAAPMAAQPVAAPTRSDVGTPGRADAVVDEGRVRRRALEIQDQWARERGQVGAPVDFSEEDRARAQARRELEAESRR